MVSFDPQKFFERLLYTASGVKKDVGVDEALYTTFIFISFLTCLHTFWHAIPTSLYLVLS